MALEKQVLIISLGAKLKIGKCKDIRDWFLANAFADFGDPVTNFFMSCRLPKDFVSDKNVQQKVVEYLHPLMSILEISKSRRFRRREIPRKKSTKFMRFIR